MLSLKLGLSLNTVTPRGGWSPSDEANLEAWYQNKVGITLNGSDVSKWNDSSTNSHDMVQATATEQPAYNGSTGALTFVAADTNNLQTTSQISLSGAFTIGIKFNPDIINTVLIADNTTANEFIKYTSTTRINIKIDGTNLSLDLDSGTIGDGYIIITRNGSNLITLLHNGVAQSGTGTVSGTSDIDCIGARKTDVNPYDGDISEIQIYSDTSTNLVSYVRDYFGNL